MAIAICCGEPEGAELTAVCWVGCCAGCFAARCCAARCCAARWAARRAAALAAALFAARAFLACAAAMDRCGSNLPDCSCRIPAASRTGWPDP